MEFGASSVFDQHKDGVEELDRNILFQAAGIGDVNTLTSIIREDPSVLECCDGEESTPLMHAVSGRQVDTVKLLLKMGASINTQDACGRTSLSLATYLGWLEGCVCLLRNGAKQSIPDKNGRLPLHAATAEKDLKLMAVLLQQSMACEINHQDNEGMTALHWASFHNRPGHVQALLQKGADPTLLDKDFKTALHWAVQAGGAIARKQMEDVDMVVLGGPDDPVIKLQFMSGSRYMCSLILDHPLGSSVINYDDENGKTCVHIAAAAGYSDILLELGRFSETNLQALDVDERTPLHWASAAGKEECVEALLQLGAEPGPRDINENTPLTYAMYCGHTACVKLLSRVNKFDAAGQPPLQGHSMAQKKEGKFHMLNQIFSCKRKKVYKPCKREPNYEGLLAGETSEVDDIITTFDRMMGTSPIGSSSVKAKLPGDHIGNNLDTKTLFPMRTQSLPPIMSDKSWLAGVQNAAQQRYVTPPLLQRFHHRSQKSKSEHDLCDSQLDGRVLVRNMCKTESKQSLVSNQSCTSQRAHSLFDKQSLSGHLDVLCQNFVPYIQSDEQVSLPPVQVSKSIKKSKSLPLQTMERSFQLPPAVTFKSQSPSMCYFLPMVNGEPLRTVQVLPAIPSQRRLRHTVTKPKTGTPGSP